MKDYLAAKDAKTGRELGLHGRVTAFPPLWIFLVLCLLTGLKLECSTPQKQSKQLSLDCPSCVAVTSVIHPHHVSISCIPLDNGRPEGIPLVAKTTVQTSTAKLFFSFVVSVPYPPPPDFLKC